MISYIIVRRRDLQNLLSVLTKRGADCWTDHCPVRAKLALKIRPKARNTTLLRLKQQSKLHSLYTKYIFVNAISLIELDEVNT